MKRKRKKKKQSDKKIIVGCGRLFYSRHVTSKKKKKEKKLNFNNPEKSGGRGPNFLVLGRLNWVRFQNIWESLYDFDDVAFNE